MHIIDVKQNTPQWFKAREGKFTSSKAGDVLGDKNFLKPDLIAALVASGVEFNEKDTIPKLIPLLTPEAKYQLFRNGPKKIGFYKLAAERLFDPLDEEDARGRGQRLEPKAIERYAKETGKIVKIGVGLCVNDDNPNICVSPDALIYTPARVNGKDVKVCTEAVEAKNFEDGHHLEACWTNKVPQKLMPQVIQYFLTIDELQIVHVVFHTDRTQHKKLQYHVVDVKREDVQYLIDYQREFEENALRLIDEIVSEYAF